MEKAPFEARLVPAAGVFALVLAVTNWGWFMTRWKVNVCVRMFGHERPRVFYTVTGVFLLVMGYLMLRDSAAG
jgi:hypothetical protein